MRALALALLASTSACAVGDPVEFLAGARTELTWDFRADACATPTDKQLELVERATEIWGDLGVALVRADERPTVVVCLTDGAPHIGYAGWTTGPTLDDRFLVEVKSDLSAESLVPVVAHEFGHVVLPGHGAQDHLQPGHDGIMAPYVARLGWWSDDDLNHLYQYGLYP